MRNFFRIILVGEFMESDQRETSNNKIVSPIRRIIVIGVTGDLVNVNESDISIVIESAK